jgi:signal transduction histidine kinase
MPVMATVSKESPGVSAESILSDERRRLARETHDQVAQPLTALLIRLRWLLDQPVIDRDEVQLLETIAADALGAARALAHDLRRRGVPDPLEQSREYAEFVLAASGCRLSWIDERRVRIAGARMDEVAHIIREAVTNVAKHSDASSASVRLIHLDGALQVEISDNGRGFDPVTVLNREADPGLGLLVSNERAESLGGSFGVRSSVLEGTVVHLVIPLRRPRPRRTSRRLPEAGSA